MMVKDMVVSSNDSQYFTSKKKTPGSGRREWREYAAGWGSGIINITVTFPINKTMFRQQLHGISAWDAASQLRREGLLSLYRLDFTNINSPLTLIINLFPEVFCLPYCRRARVLL